MTIKVRRYDFSTVSRSVTLASPTDDGALIGRTATRLLEDLETTGGVRLLGVGVSGLADWVQDDLFSDAATEETPEEPDDGLTDAQVDEAGARHRSGWYPGMDVIHEEHGRGWVWGSGTGVVTVRFETADTPPGPVKSFATDDPLLSPWQRDAGPEEAPEGRSGAE